MWVAVQALDGRQGHAAGMHGRDGSLAFAQAEGGVEILRGAAVTTAVPLL